MKKLHIPHLLEIIVATVLFLLLSVISELDITNSYELGGTVLALVVSYCAIIALFLALLFMSPKSYGRFESLTFFAFTPVLCFFIVDGLNGVNVFSFDPWTAGINIGAYVMLQLLIYAIFGRMRTTIIVTATVSFMFGLINHFVMEFRGNPFMPWDIFSVKTALSVANNYKFTLNFAIIASTVLLILTVILAVRVNFVDKRFNKSPFNIILGRVSVLTIVGGFSFILLGTSVPAEIGIFEFPWNQSSAYRANGSLTSFLLNTKYLMIERPDSYSTEKVQEVADAVPQSKDNVTADNPNIIVIMNEALSDLQSVWDFSTSEDPLKFIHSLENDPNAQVGKTYVSVHGGTTCNSEFEFLTGNTMGFFPTGSVPFQQYIKDTAVSLPNLLDIRGYSSDGLHPYNATGWSRDKVYPMLGFEQFTTLKDWVQPSYVRDYVSDSSNYGKVIDTLQEKAAGEQSFIFNITMQNHSGYATKGFNSTIKLEGMDGDYPQAEQYLSLLKHSDKAFADLINHFKSVDEKTIILMFGDHQPAIEAEFYEELYGKSLDELTLDELQKRFVTPYILWSNYGVSFPDVPEISANFLSSLLLKSAGQPLPKYNAFLEDLRQTLPIINGNGYMDTSGTWYNWGEKSPHLDRLNDYRTLQYNAIVDKTGRVPSIFE